MAWIPLLSFLFLGCETEDPPADPAPIDETTTLASAQALEDALARIATLEAEMKQREGEIAALQMDDSIAFAEIVDHDHALATAAAVDEAQDASLQSLEATSADHEARVGALESVSGVVENDYEARITALEGTTASQGVDLGAVAAQVTDAQNDMIEAQADIADLQSDTDGVADLLDLVGVDASGDVVVTGANLRVVNGNGATATTNGKGNVIIGYDETDGVDDKSGSHNLVLGTLGTYTSYGGIIGGYDNAVTGVYGSAISGRANTVGGIYTAVVSGYMSETVAGSDYGATLGGHEVSVSANYGVAVAGYQTLASGTASAVIGGRENEASGSYANVTGGRSNLASGSYAAVSGGYINTASGSYSSAVGDDNQVASASYEVLP